MHRTLVLDVAGLTEDCLGPHTPNLSRLAARGGARPIQSIFPAVAGAVEATYVTGALPRTHGVVADAWFERGHAELSIGATSSGLVSGDKLWDAARRIDRGFTCALLFAQLGRYASVDWSVTPAPARDGERPHLPCDPPGLAEELRAALGAFPFGALWGPRAGMAASRWIARAARHLLDARRPTLTIARLPGLEIEMTRFGPHHPRIAGALREIDEICGELVEEAESEGMRVLVLSGYGIAHVDAPVFPNRVLRAAGLVRLRVERGRELLDPGASEAFAVTNHQLAHVYVRCPERVAEVAALLRATPGVDQVLERAGQRAFGVDHARAGELVAIARPGSWFAYPWWLDDARAPHFAREVEPHRKPGIDPGELFVDPALPRPRTRLALRRLSRWAGLRVPLDVVPLDASLVHGSHGRLPEGPDVGPLVVTSDPELLGDRPIRATDVKDLVLRHVYGERAREAAPTTRASP